MFFQRFLSHGVPLPNVLHGPMWILTTRVTNQLELATVNPATRDSSVLNVSFVFKVISKRILFTLRVFYTERKRTQRRTLSLILVVTRSKNVVNDLKKPFESKATFASALARCTLTRFF